MRSRWRHNQRGNGRLRSQFTEGGANDFPIALQGKRWSVFDVLGAQCTFLYVLNQSERRPSGGSTVWNNKGRIYKTGLR